MHFNNELPLVYFILYLPRPAPPSCVRPESFDIFRRDDIVYLFADVLCFIMEGVEGLLLPGYQQIKQCFFSYALH